MTDVLTPEDAKERLAVNLPALIASRGWSQYRLAQETGEDQMTISRVIRGMTDPRASTLARIAEALGVTVDECLKPIKSAARKKSRIGA